VPDDLDQVADAGDGEVGSTPPLSTGQIPSTGCISGEPVTEPERSDEELAAEECDGDLLAVIQFPVWSPIRAAGLEHAVLVAAEDGGLAAVNALIRQGRRDQVILPPARSV